MFSHWVLDFVVHRPDLPLFDDASKVGLGLWDAPLLAIGPGRASIFFGGLWLCIGDRLGRSRGTVALGLLMFAIETHAFFGPPPALGPNRGGHGTVCLMPCLRARSGGCRIGVPRVT